MMKNKDGLARIIMSISGALLTVSVVYFFPVIKEWIGQFIDNPLLMFSVFGVIGIVGLVVGERIHKYK